MFRSTVNLSGMGNASSAAVSAPENKHTKGSTGLPALAARLETSLKNSTARIQNGTPSLSEEISRLPHSSAQEEMDRRATDPETLPRMTIKDGRRSEDAGSFQAADKQPPSEARDADPDTAMTNNQKAVQIDPLVLAAAHKFSDGKKCLHKWSVNDLARNEEEKSHFKKQLKEFDNFMVWQLGTNEYVPSIAQMSARNFWDKCKSRQKGSALIKDKSDYVFESGWSWRYKNSAYPAGYVLLSIAVEKNNLVAAIKILQGALLAKRDGLADEGDFIHQNGDSLLQAEQVWSSMTPDFLRLILSADMIAVNPTTGCLSPLAALCKAAPAERIGDLMRILFDAGAELNTPACKPGRTPLNLACEKALDASIVKALLEGGADPNTPDTSGCTPLTRACEKALDASIVKALLEGGADPNTPDMSGYTPLILTCEYARDASIAKALLAGGANPNTPDKHGRTPLGLLLCRNGCPASLEKLDILLNDPGIDLGPLCTPAEHRDRGYLKAEYGVLESSALFVGIENGKLPEVKRLLRQPGIDLNGIPKGKQFGPLAKAVAAYRWRVFKESPWQEQQKALGIVKALISNGARLSTREKGGRGPVRDYEYDLARHFSTDCDSMLIPSDDMLAPLYQLFRQYRVEQPATRCLIQ